MSGEQHQGLRRYPGASSFKDTEDARRVFFGRDEEKRALLHQVIADDLVVVFGRSGHGKTSLISAGLLEPLRQEGYFPVIARVNAKERTPMEAVMDAVEEAATSRPGYEYEPGDRTSLWHFFKTVEIWRDDLRLRPVLILDQFEELFTVQLEQAKEAFLGEFIDLVRDAVPEGKGGDVSVDLSDAAWNVKVVLSLREDFLAELEILGSRLPVFASRFRVGPLLREQAKSAIVNPTTDRDPRWESDPFTWSEEELTRLLDFLCRDSNPPAVLPFQLQLLCHHAESLVIDGGGGPTIEPGELGAFDDVLSGFYERALDDVVAEADEADRWPLSRQRRLRRLRRLCERGLIRAERRMSLDPAFIGDEYGVHQSELKRLVDERLLAVDARTGGSYYELSHDTLVDPILTSRQRRHEEAWRKARPWVAAAGVALALWGATFPDQWRDDMLVASADEIIDQHPDSSHLRVAEVLLNEVINYDRVPGTGQDGWRDGVQAYLRAAKGSLATWDSAGRAENSASVVAVRDNGEVILGSGSAYSSLDLDDPTMRFTPADSSTLGGARLLRVARGSVSGWVALGFDRGGALFLPPPGPASAPVRVARHEAAVRGIDISGNGRWAASADEDGRIWLTDLEASPPRQVATYDVEEIVWTLALHPSKPLLAVATRAGEVTLWTWTERLDSEGVQSLSRLGTVDAGGGGGVNVSMVDFGATHGDDLVVVRRFGESWVLDVSQDRLGGTFALDTIYVASLSPDRSRLLTMSNEGTLSLRNMEVADKEVVARVGHPGSGNARWVGLLDAHAHDAGEEPFVAASARADGTVRLWEAEGDGLSGRYVELSDQGASVALVEREEAGDLLVSGGADGFLQIYELDRLANLRAVEVFFADDAGVSGAGALDSRELKMAWNDLGFGCFAADTRQAIRDIRLTAEDGEVYPPLSPLFAPLDLFVGTGRAMREWFKWLPGVEPDSLDRCRRTGPGRALANDESEEAGRGVADLR